MYVHISSIYYYHFLQLDGSHSGVDGPSFLYLPIVITCNGNIMELQRDLQLSPCAITMSLLNFTAAAMFYITNIRHILSVFLYLAVLEKCAVNLDESIY
jgi:hypothetical protein